MEFFSASEPLRVTTFCEFSNGCFEATLSNGITISTTIVSIAGTRYASFACSDKRLQPEGPEPVDCWKLPEHLTNLKAIDVVAIATESQLNMWVAAINRLCLATKRPWVNVQELTSLLVGSPS